MEGGNLGSAARAELHCIMSLLKSMCIAHLAGMIKMKCSSLLLISSFFLFGPKAISCTVWYGTAVFLFGYVYLFVADKFCLMRHTEK